MSLHPHLSPETRSLTLPGAFVLDSGEQLADVEVAYRSWGRRAPAGDNAVLVCHALTGSADVDRWWPGLLGPGRALDPERDFILCSNVLGGCYGTTGPASSDARGERVLGARFPRVSVRDMVRLQMRWLEALGVRRLRLVLGGSLGGMQVLEWALLAPELVEAIAPISVSGRHSAWCIAWSEAQRRAIAADPRWKNGEYDAADPPAAGLAAARMMAMVSYRSRESFDARFGRERGSGEDFEVERYLRHQGEVLVDRFDAISYVTLTRAMDAHDVAAGRGEYPRVLASIRQPALVVGTKTDVLYPLAEQEELAGGLVSAELACLDSPHGHDAFLIEQEQLNRLLLEFRVRAEASSVATGGRP